MPDESTSSLAGTGAIISRMGNLMDVLPARSKAKIEREWGTEGWHALHSFCEYLGRRNFTGPLSVKEPCFLSFTFDPYDATRVVASISKFDMDAAGRARFDFVITIYSATIFKFTADGDPWYPIRLVDEKWLQGYAACLVARLSNLKWAEKESSENPIWLMTNEGVSACIRDIDSLIIPHLLSLHSDADLDRLLTCVRQYQQPKWVLSDRPGFRNLDLRQQALNRGLNTNCDT